MRNVIQTYILATAVAVTGFSVYAQEKKPTKGKSPIVSASGNKKISAAHFEIDASTKSLIVTTDPETNAIIQQVLAQLDKVIPQALIKVQFVEVTHSNGLDVGVDAKYSDTEKSGESSIVETLVGTANITQGGAWAILDGNLEVTLKALATANKMEVLSRPSIMARSNEEATIIVGQEVPFIRNSQVTDDGRTINTIEYEDIGIILKVTPDISDDGLVKMTIAPEISTLTGETVTISDGVEAPTFAKRSAETKVTVPSGKTVVIGGLMDTTETETKTKVPILGDIPLLGWFFRRTVKSKVKTELLIFLTPQVVKTTDESTALTEEEKNDAIRIRKLLDKAKAEKALEKETYELHRR